MRQQTSKHLATAAAVGIIAGVALGLTRGLEVAKSNEYADLGLLHLRRLTIVDEVRNWLLACLGLSLGAYLFALIFRVFLRKLCRGAIDVRILEPSKLTRRATWIGALTLALFAGWLANRHLLPYRFAPVSLAADLAILLAAAGLAWTAPKLVTRHRLGALARWTRRSAALLFLLVVAAHVGIFARTVGPTQKTNVLLISVDTLRYDALGVNGAVIPDITPNLDRFARNAVNFHQAISTSSWTLPSHMSLMTSLYHPDHGMDTAAAWNGTVTLDPAVPTLAEYLRNAGYRTHAVTGGGFVRGEFGFERGFETYRDEPERLERSMPRLIELLGELRDEPFFIFFHTYEVHAPYRHPHYLDRVEDLSSSDQVQLVLGVEDASLTATPKRFGSFLKRNGWMRAEITRALYDGGVRHFDQEFARLVARLEELDLFRSTLIVLTSDHGEEFGEHNDRSLYDAHGHGLFEELVRVPLLIRRPGERQEAEDRRDLVSLVDVVPTILSEVRLKTTGKTEGRDLFGTRGTVDDAKPRYVFAETNLKSRSVMHAVRSSALKLIERGVCDSKPCGQARFLYDLVADPGETYDALAAHPEDGEALAIALDAYMGQPSATAAAKTSESQLRDELRALGYVD